MKPLRHLRLLKMDRSVQLRQLQLKIVGGKSSFDDVTGQAVNDSERFEFSIALIFDITKDRKYYKYIIKKNIKE